jgi:hypothetical protein
VSEEKLNALCELARQRVRAHINRVASQQPRRMREAWSKTK